MSSCWKAVFAVMFGAVSPLPTPAAACDSGALVLVETAKFKQVHERTHASIRRRKAEQADVAEELRLLSDLFFVKKGLWSAAAGPARGGAYPVDAALAQQELEDLARQVEALEKRHLALGAVLNDLLRKEALFAQTVQDAETAKDNATLHRDMLESGMSPELMVQLAQHSEQIEKTMSDSLRSMEDIMTATGGAARDAPRRAGYAAAPYEAGYSRRMRELLAPPAAPAALELRVADEASSDSEPDAAPVQRREPRPAEPSDAALEQTLARLKQSVRAARGHGAARAASVTAPAASASASASPRGSESEEESKSEPSARAGEALLCA